MLRLHAATVVLLAWAGVAHAQDGADLRTAQPERPTVATHAWTVASRYAELETGIEWDRNRDGSYSLSTPSVMKLGVGRRTQLGLFGNLSAGTDVTLGPGDAGVVLKYRLADDLPVVGAFAVAPAIKFPAGTGPRGTHTTDASLVLISSHKLGPIALDINAGYTRRSGTGDSVPRNATVWTVSTGGPLAGRLGFAAELFGYPATAGPSGATGSVALLAGPVLTLQPWAVLDAGAIIRLHGDQPHAVYAGLVYNFGRF